MEVSPVSNLRGECPGAPLLHPRCVNALLPAGCDVLRPDGTGAGLRSLESGRDLGQVARLEGQAPGGDPAVHLLGRAGTRGRLAADPRGRRVTRGGMAEGPGTL